MAVSTRIRLPDDLHGALVKAAEQQGVSLNTLMLVLLAGGINFKLPAPRLKAGGHVRTPKP